MLMWAVTHECVMREGGSKRAMAWIALFFFFLVWNKRLDAVQDKQIRLMIPTGKGTQCILG